MQHLVDELVAATRERADYEAKYLAFITPLDLKIAKLRANVADELKKIGQLSARFDSATVTRTVRKRLRVVDEPLLIQELKLKGLTSYVSEQLNDLWEGAAKELVKEGTVLPGTTIEEKESLSLKPKDKPEQPKAA
jgi:hypothetical protein